MSSFNNIKKIDYSDNRDSIVALKEYILLKDEAGKKQLLVFKFQNNLNQELSKMTFNVMQYDSDHFMIKKSTINYEDFTVDRGEAFVPKLKMEVDIFCDTIEVELTYAKFERVEYINGIMKPITYTHEEFVGNKIEIEKASKKEEKLKEKQRIKELKKNSKESDKRKMEVLDVTNRNKPLSTAVLTSIMSIVLVVFVIATVAMFYMNSNLFNDGDYMFKKLSGNTVSIYKYYGNDSTITIPKTYNDYEIVEIDKKAYKDKDAFELTFSAPINLGESAFENCKNLSKINGIEYINRIGDKTFRNCSSLTKFDSNELDYIGVRAFENCTSLKSLEVPNTQVDTEAFKGCSNLNTLNIKDTEGSHLSALFGNEKNNLKTLTIARKTINTGYFQNMDNLTKLSLIGEPTIDFGALAGTNISGHYINETVETLDGKIIAVKPDDFGMITLPHTITDYQHTYDFLNKISDKIKVIQTGMSIEIDSDFLSIFDNLIGFGLSGDGVVDRNIIANNFKIKELYWDSYSNITDYLVLPNSVDSIYFGNHKDTKYYIDEQFDDLDLYNYKIYNLYVDNAKGYTNESLKSLNYLEYLETKNVDDLNLLNAGISNTIQEVVITEDDKLTKLNLMISALDNLTIITFPKNITKLEAHITDCKNLKTINIPENVTEIGESFLYNVGVTKINFNDKLTKINSNFMYYCNSISEIVLPASLKNIGDFTFVGCANLTNISLPEKVESIGRYLIEEGINLLSLEIPDSVKSLTLPIIGNNCKVTRIKTPFVGANSSEHSTFKEFSNTLDETYQLEITGNLNIKSDFTYGLANLNTFIVMGEIIGAKTNQFSNLVNLRNIRFTGELPVAFKNLFTSGVTLDKVYLSTKSKITENFFSNMNITSLAIIKYDAMSSVDTFKNTNISNLFIANLGDTTFNKEAFYTTTNSYVSYLYFDVLPKMAKDKNYAKEMSFNEFEATYLDF